MAGLVCNFCEEMVGLPSVASTVVLSAKVAVVESNVDGRSTVYSRYNNGPRTLVWGIPALIGFSSVYSVSTFINDNFLYGNIKY
jgi:hypothetical protein